MEEALCRIISNSSIEHLHPNRKARVPSVPTKFGIQVGPEGEPVCDAALQTDTLLQERLGCKTWSELGFSCATSCVVQIKLRPIAFLIVLTDRIGIKAHQKKGQTEVIRVELCYTRVKCVWSECGPVSYTHLTLPTKRIV